MKKILSKIKESKTALLFFVPFCIALGIIETNYSNVFSDQNLSYYLFSTIVQGFLSLVGILGAVAIFKIQLLENESLVITESGKKFMEHYKGFCVNCYTPKEMLDETQNILNDDGNHAHREQIKKTQERLSENNKEKLFIRETMVRFVLLSFINVSVALIGISLSKLLIMNELYFLMSVYSIINLSFSISVLLVSLEIIKHIIGQSKDS